SYRSRVQFDAFSTFVRRASPSCAREVSVESWSASRYAEKANASWASSNLLGDTIAPPYRQKSNLNATPAKLVAPTVAAARIIFAFCADNPSMTPDTCLISGDVSLLLFHAACCARSKRWLASSSAARLRR